MNLPSRQLSAVLLTFVISLSLSPRFAEAGTVGGGGSGGTLCAPEGETAPSSRMFYEDLHIPVVVDFIRLAVPDYPLLNVVRISKDYLKRFGFTNDIVFEGRQVKHNFGSQDVDEAEGRQRMVATKNVLWKKKGSSSKEMVRVVLSTLTWRPSPESQDTGDYELTIEAKNSSWKIRESGRLNCLGY